MILSNLRQKIKQLKLDLESLSHDPKTGEIRDIVPKAWIDFPSDDETAKTEYTIILTVFDNDGSPLCYRKELGLSVRVYKDSLKYVVKDNFSTPKYATMDTAFWKTSADKIAEDRILRTLDLVCRLTGAENNKYIVRLPQSKYSGRIIHMTNFKA